MQVVMCIIAIVSKIKLCCIISINLLNHIGDGLFTVVLIKKWSVALAKNESIVGMCYKHG